MKFSRSISFASVLFLAMLLARPASGQVQMFVTPALSNSVTLGSVSPSSPPMTSDLTLQALAHNDENQARELAGYTATTVIAAELPESSQKAEFELTRKYVAPKLLQFTPVRFTGDPFVKSNIIIRLLQSEVDRVEKGETAQTAIAPQNYKFSYKMTQMLNGTKVHVFAVKPRRKQAGLFKGSIYVDAANGRLCRAEGRLVKSPSFFIKRIDFVQDYKTVADFTFPVYMHSVALTRLVGRVVVNIVHRDYQPAFETTATVYSPE